MLVGLPLQKPGALCDHAESSGNPRWAKQRTANASQSRQRWNDAAARSQSAAVRLTRGALRGHVSRLMCCTHVRSVNFGVFTPAGILCSFLDPCFRVIVLLRVQGHHSYRTSLAHPWRSTSSLYKYRLSVVRRPSNSSFHTLTPHNKYTRALS
jgi:hypothetical protein